MVFLTINNGPTLAFQSNWNIFFYSCLLLLMTYSHQQRLAFYESGEFSTKRNSWHESLYWASRFFCFRTFMDLFLASKLLKHHFQNRYFWSSDWAFAFYSNPYYAVTGNCLQHKTVSQSKPSSIQQSTYRYIGGSMSYLKNSILYNFTRSITIRFRFIHYPWQRRIYRTMSVPRNNSVTLTNGLQFLRSRALRIEVSCATIDC